MRWTEIEMTRMTTFSRRTLLGALAAAMLPLNSHARPGGRLYLSARGDAAGGFRATGIRVAGGIAFDLPLPARGHSMALRSGGREAVFFGRRPGAFALLVDIAGGRPLRTIEATPGRWFNGHGVFAADGARLFASETVGDTGDGMIGVYDPADDYRRIGEWPSGGLDPHDIRLLSDGRTLAVANGGILHHTEAPRTILNLDTMAPSLAYVDARDGAILAAVGLPAALHQLSIHHLAVAPGDRVALAGQYQGPSGDRVPLVGMHRPGAPEIRLIGPPEAVARSMRHYCGSAAMDPSGRILGATSPRGGVAAFWDVREDRYLGSYAMADCCGIAPGASPGVFLISNGHGDVACYDARAARAGGSPGTLLAGARWDNHMLAVGAA
jgi:hypothetical protein